MKGQLYSENIPRNYPCVMEDIFNHAIAIWHSPKEYTVLVQGAAIRFAGQYKDAPPVGKLVRRTDGEDLSCKNWRPLPEGTQILITV